MVPAPEHGATLHDRAFVDAAVAADQDVVFDDHGRGSHGLQHASELGGGGEVDVLAHLGAAPHESMGIDQRAISHPGADVDVHGRHADHPPAQVAAVADGGAPGDHTHAVPEAQRPGRVGRLVEEGEADASLAAPHRHVHDLAHTEAGEDPLFHPGVHPPARGGFGVRLGGPGLAPVQSLLEAIEELAVLPSVDGRRLGVEPLDAGAESCQILSRQAGPPGARLRGSRGSVPGPEGPSRSSAGSPAWAPPRAAGRRARSIP